VALAALKEVFPMATISLVANAKTLELFAGDPHVQLCAIEYPRSGGLIERLAIWLRVLEALRQATAGLDPAEYVIVDPDSRLTQLGLLQHMFGIHQPIYPYCAPSLHDVAAAKRIVDTLKSRAMGPIVSVNLGVGANPAKRLPDPFEMRLLTRLLSEGATVILDKGGDAEEVGRIEALVTSLGGKGFRALALDERRDVVSSPAEVGGASLLTWQGSIGRFTALIAESTAYIGYDSAGQHIAAALGVATIDIFTGFTSPRMPERWSPHGLGSVHVRVLDAAETYSSARLDAIVDDVLAHIPRG
jgi:ADP-heptose:LPS heptosyltransferase